MRTILVGALVVSLLMAGRPQPAASASALEWELPSGHFFTQANGFPTGSSPKGFSVTDDGGVRFWSEFQRLGGVDSLGYPVSRRFIWDGYVSQAMQKGVLQWRPDQGKALLVNALDQLTAASKDDWLFNVRGTPRPLDSSFDAGKSPSDIVNARLALLDARPAMRDAYFGVDEPLQRYGLPTSRVEDMGTAYVVRLQRAVLQEWKVDTAWARAGQVTVANGGDLAKEAGILPAKAPYPEDPPPGLWKPQAGEYRVSGDATWYGGQFHGRKMANGQTYDMNDVTTVASNMYPLGTKVKITHGTTGASITAVVKDTGGFRFPIVADLSFAAFGKLADPKVGRIPAVVEVLPP